MPRQVFWCAVVFVALSEIAHAISLEVCQQLPSILTNSPSSGTDTLNIPFTLNTCGTTGGRSFALPLSINDTTGLSRAMHPGIPSMVGNWDVSAANSWLAEDRCMKSEAEFGCATGAGSANLVLAERVLIWILHEQLGAKSGLLPDDFDASVNALYLDAKAEKVDAITSEFIKFESMPEPPILAILGAILVGLGAWVQWQRRKFQRSRA